VAGHSTTDEALMWGLCCIKDTLLVVKMIGGCDRCIVVGKTQLDEAITTGMGSRDESVLPSLRIKK